MNKNYTEFEKPLINWLVNSGVFINKDQKNVNSGGVHAGYNLSINNWQFIYCEITGYSISTFCLLYKKYNDKKFLDYAIENALFLMKHQINNPEAVNFGSFPQGLNQKTNSIMPNCYTFDAAMCIQGLLDLYSIVKDDRFLSSAVIAGNWLLKMQDKSGAFLAYYNPERKLSEDKGPFFYQDAGCLHGKNAIALIKLFKATNNEKFKKSAIRLCDWTIKLQDIDGSFWANDYKYYVYTHAHCYATEGLIYAFKELGFNRYKKSVVKACDWLENNLDKNTNTILGSHKISNNFN